MRDQRERLLDILEAIERAEKHAGKGRAVFELDELVQVWARRDDCGGRLSAAKPSRSVLAP